MSKAILCICFIVIASLSSAQNNQIDSLKALVLNAPEDTTKVNTLINLSNKLVGVDPEETIFYSTQAKELAEKLGFKNGMGFALKSIGMGYYFKADYLDAILSWEQSLKIFEEIGNKLGVANMANNIGAIHYNEGDNTKAIDYYLRSLKVSEEIGDKLRIATALVNIGAVYSVKEGTHDMALQYYRRALPLGRDLNDYEAYGTVAVNMGEIFLHRQEMDSALFYFNTSLEAYKKAQVQKFPIR